MFEAAKLDQGDSARLEEPFDRLGPPAAHEKPTSILRGCPHRRRVGRVLERVGDPDVGKDAAGH